MKSRSEKHRAQFLFPSHQLLLLVGVTPVEQALNKRIRFLSICSSAIGGTRASGSAPTDSQAEAGRGGAQGETAGCGMRRHGDRLILNAP